MTKTLNPIRLALADALTPAGFERKGDSWFRASNEVVEVVNLQKSQYGNQYYVNVAFWLKLLGDEVFPKEERCHIRLRLDDVTSPGTLQDQALDLGAQFRSGEDERRRDLARTLVEQLLPFVDSCRTLAGMKDAFESGRFQNAMVVARARQLLESDSEGAEA